MESAPTIPETSAVNVIKNDSDQIDIEKIKNIVTEEQVHSDTIARRRRRFTKKRSTSLTRRDPTPVRKLDDKCTSDEEIVESKPKTPERPRRPKRNKSLIKHNLSETDTPSVEDSNKSNNVSRSSSFQKKLKTFEAKIRRSEETVNLPEEKPRRKKSLSDLAQDEMVAILNKTKKTITNAAIKGRERFRKEKEKRSQSAPNKIIKDQELIESFKQAQLNQQLDQEDQISEVTPTQKVRKYSDTSINSVIPDIEFYRPIIKKAKAMSRASISKLKQRKKPDYSSKIVEILDPTTKHVLTRKTVVKLPEVRLRDVFKILRFYSIFEIIRAYRLYKVEMKTEYKKIKTLWTKCMFELFLIMMFCGTAGFIFKFIEGRSENYYKCGVKRVKRDFIDLLWMKSHNLREDDWKSLFRNKLRTFEEELHVAHEAGMTTYSGQRSWSFLNGVVYALTIITTIGYGHIYPSTKAGRALTIVYALVGIPLFLIALTDFGKLFTRGIKFLWSFVRRLYYTGSCRKVRKSATASEIFKGAQLMYGIATFRRPSTVTSDPSIVDPEVPPVFRQQISVTDRSIVRQVSRETTIMSEDTPTTPELSTFEIDDEFNLPISVALLILVAYMFIGALVYCAWEQWEFFSSFYFVFISLSTVGFGDFIPANPTILIISIVYLVFGLALMSMCINVVQDKLSDTFQQASLKLSSSMGFEVDESETSVDDPEVVPVHGDIEAEKPKDVDDKNENNNAIPTNDVAPPVSKVV